ncbi:uncharacterized protein DS421_14g483660 [Arachis hypogaea]|nr:uncharacterized protein DS421_14g483660 [Arachis hypogaea]
MISSIECFQQFSAVCHLFSSFSVVGRSCDSFVCVFFQQYRLRSLLTVSSALPSDSSVCVSLWQFYLCFLVAIPSGFLVAVPSMLPSGSFVCASFRQFCLRFLQAVPLHPFYQFIHFFI